jgi:signal peptidase II
LASIALIFSGAIGNIIDSLFYGMIFNHSYGQVADFLPEGGGYATFLHGRVVDMFYFPIIQTTLPEWLPFWGGNRFHFLPARIQHCRFIHNHWNFFHFVVLPETI